jgi:DNA polymerase-3 subunit delta'
VGFSEFIGNERIVAALGGMLASGRVPHAVLFTGPRGVGKFTLARMFAQAANCERGGADFCGECDTCLRIGRLADPAPLIEAGLAERGESADAATVERVPLLVETHPDVWLVVPDPVRLKNPVARPMLRVAQLRAVQRAAYFRPVARRRVFIVEGAETMKPGDTDLFLKILEEPPETSTLILLATNPHLLAPTIQSRCMQFRFAPLAAEAVEQVLQQRTKLKPGERRLAAQLADGSPGRALELDLAESARRRRLALGLVEQAVEGARPTELFQRTEQLAKKESESFENLLELFYSLTRDLLAIRFGPPGAALRNPDLAGELERLSRKVDFEWIARAVARLDTLHARQRRNVNRQLGLEAWTVAAGGGRAGRRTR